MIVDSSALLAILLDEPDAPALLNALVDAPRPRMSAANWLEVAMLIEEKGGASPACASTNFSASPA